MASLLLGVGSLGCLIVGRQQYSFTVGCWVVGLFDCWRNIVLCHFCLVLGRWTVELLEDYSIASLLFGVGSLGCLIVERQQYGVTSVGCWAFGLF